MTTSDAKSQDVGICCILRAADGEEVARTHRAEVFDDGTVEFMFPQGFNQAGIPVASVEYTVSRALSSPLISGPVDSLGFKVGPMSPPKRRRPFQR